MAGGRIDEDTWAEICRYYTVNGIVCCAYCGEPATEREHVVPIAHGGKEEPANKVPACQPCNQRKGQRTWDVPDPHPWMRKEASE